MGEVIHSSLSLLRTFMLTLNTRVIPIRYAGCGTRSSSQPMLYPCFVFSLILTNTALNVSCVQKNCLVMQAMCALEGMKSQKCVLHILHQQCLLHFIVARIWLDSFSYNRLIRCWRLDQAWDPVQPTWLRWPQIMHCCYHHHHPPLLL